MKHTAIERENKTVTVFGSSLPKSGDKEYENAYLLGQILGNAGINVCSGGYQGIMDAVSKGAFETGVKTFGITVDIFGATPSKFLTEQIEMPTLFERLNKLINIGDAYIVLSGGTGTMLELSVVWEKMIKGLIPEKPTVCLGNMWENIVMQMEARISFENRRAGLIKCVDNIEDCSVYIIKSLNYKN